MKWEQNKNKHVDEYKYTEQTIPIIWIVVTS